LSVAPVAHEAQVWLLDLRPVPDAALASFGGWLDPSEALRLAGFVRPARRRQFVAGRVLARQALGQLLGIPAREVRLFDSPGKAPVLALPGHERVGLSISHSGHWVACAVSATSRLGLDVELLDPERDFDAMCAQAFGEEQQRWLQARPAASRVRDFYRMWSGAEARFKLQVPCADEVELFHPELSVVLCCEHALARPPSLRNGLLI
jgi:4'-phosphopantetheinyl transferase